MKRKHILGKKAQSQGAIAAVIFTVVAMIGASVLWQFSQGASGSLRELNDAVTFTENSSFVALEFGSIDSGSDSGACSNGTVITRDTDYFIRAGQGTVAYNGTLCGKFDTVSSVAARFDYSYKNELYMASNPLARLVFSYLAVAFGLGIIVSVLYLVLGRRGDE